MNEPNGAEAPLQMPRRFAIRLLHEAQLAGEQPFVGVVGASAEPDTFLPMARPSLGEAAALLQDRQRSLWAVYLHRPGSPAMPTPEDFASQPQVLRLTASLATKGVLQLRAWTLHDGRVVERELQIRD
ncbi:MAG: hypothetical protein P4L83_09765 [Nevskia sp.]|nr:hypothetical protein [Nevskia sp.]